MIGTETCNVIRLTRHCVSSKVSRNDGAWQKTMPGVIIEFNDLNRLNARGFLYGPATRLRETLEGM